MIRLRHKVLIHTLRIADQAIAAAALASVAAPWSSGDGISPGWHTTLANAEPRDMAAALALGVLSIFTFDKFAHYDANRFTTLRRELTGLIKASTALTILLLLYVVVMDYSRPDAPRLVLFWLICTTSLTVSRVLATLALRKLRKSGMSDRHILIVGCGERALEFASQIESLPELGYKIIGFICPSPNSPVAPLPSTGRWPNLGKIDDIQQVVADGTVDEVAVCLPVMTHFPYVARVVEYCRDVGIVVRVIPDANEAPILVETQLEYFGGHAIITIFRENLLFQLLLKRLLDVGVAAVLLITLSPVLIAVAIAIKLTSPGPVFFIQERVGMNKRRFKLLKFRSMVVDAEARKKELAHLNEMDGPVFKIKNDPRITAIGRFIRKTSIDELPQLLNVLHGSMSLVGPRPPVPSEVQKYEWLFQHRLSIKPGITCLWQISGRNNISFAEWMALDRKYIENWSLWLDIKILFKTVPAVLFARGAS